MKAWFMYDNHTFARVELGDRRAMIKRVGDLFFEDGCGMLFVKDESDASLESLTVHGRRQADGKYGVKASDVEDWADAVLAEMKFRTYMDA